MKKKLTKRKVSSWIGTAAQELHLIKERWKVSSNRKFYELLDISSHTLQKLNPDKPDGSLKIEVIIKIFNNLRAQVPIHFGKDKEEEEHRLLSQAQDRIMLAMVPVTPR